MKLRLANRCWRHVLQACATAVCYGVAATLLAQLPRTGVGKDFLFPDYYPPDSNGVVRVRSVVRGKEYQLLSNNIVNLTAPRVESFQEDGTNLQWTASARAALVDIKTREVSGSTNVFFRTADDQLFVTGVGFLWQQSNSVLILSNDTFTWMQIRTNTLAKTNKMKALMAATMVATARLSAAEMEVPPQRPGIIIKAGRTELDLKSSFALLTNGVLVTYPPARSNEATTFLSCAWATVKRGTNGQIEEVTAHGKVAVDKGDEHARGNYAVYTATNEMLALVGAYDPADRTRPLPYLYSPKGTNEGEAIIYDRPRNLLTTLESIIHVPAAMLKNLNSNNAPATNATRRAAPADRPRNQPPSQ